MASAKRTYMKRLFGLLAVYGVTLTVSLEVVRAHREAPWRYAVAILPVLPLLPIPWAVLTFIRTLDELERRKQLEALAFSFVATALVTFSYGLLQTVGLPELNWMFVWPVLSTFWCLGLLLANRRYA